MNVPTHYNTMDDAEVLRDLFARNYGNSPMLGYVCDRWGLLVEEIEDQKNAIEQMSQDAAEAELRAEERESVMQDKLDSATKLLLAMEKDVLRWEAKADELQMEVEHLSAQLVFAQRILGED